MVKTIKPEQLPTDQKAAYDGWLEYFDQAINSQPFVPSSYLGEDKNLLAFRSKEAFISWYGQPPGNEPYRDDGFYTRELTWLSAWCKPKIVAEFGSDKGIGTFILSRLNPDAEVHTIDNRDLVPMPPADQRVRAGFFALPCRNAYFHVGNSKNFAMSHTDFCFIDGDHSEQGVWNDSLRAWINRNEGNRWVIVWHDYRNTEEMAGLRAAIFRFSNFVRKKVYRFEDSSTVFMTSEDIPILEGISG